MDKGSSAILIKIILVIIANPNLYSIYILKYIHLHHTREKGTFSCILSNLKKTVKSWAKNFALAVMWENIPKAAIENNKIIKENM